MYGLSSYYRKQYEIKTLKCINDLYEQVYMGNLCLQSTDFCIYGRASSEIWGS